MFNNNIIEYKTCELCFKQLIKINHLYCKKCGNKKHSKQISSGNVLKMKYNKHSRTLTNLLDASQKYIGKENIY
jgi:hypothetical protein